MIKTYSEALKKIFKRENIKDYNLDNIKKAAKLLGSLNNNFKIIHIVGTNGKGSVAKMVFYILKESKKSIGVFTSPHLIDIRERFETNDGLITKQEFVDILNKILCLKVKLSYFEICFLMALEFFRIKHCEYVIIEVGMGGRFDATNIIEPVITTITSISFDHMEFLGETLDEIAFEKAGIMKDNIPVVLNFRNRIIEEQAKIKNSKIIFTKKRIKTNLLGDYQEKNVALASEICKYLHISEASIFEGLKKVKHFGRLQFIKSNILLDGAHNEDAIKNLKKYVKNNLENKYTKIFYCFSIKKGKNINLVIDNIGKNNNFILVDIKNEILENLGKYKEKYEFKTKQEILILAEKNNKYLYIIFGSLYMIGEFL